MSLLKNEKAMEMAFHYPGENSKQKFESFEKFFLVKGFGSFSLDKSKNIQI